MAAEVRRKIYGGGGWQFRLVRRRADFFLRRRRISISAGGGGWIRRLSVCILACLRSRSCKTKLRTQGLNGI